MRKLLSLLLALSLLLGLAGCALGDQPSAYSETTELSPTEGTTLPLNWPPLPEETEPTEATEETPQLPEQTQPPQQEQPEETRPVIKPTAPVVTEPVYTEPPETEPEPTPEPTPAPTEPVGYLDPNGTYDSKEDVALYIHLYGRLPNNFITKRQAESLGWSGSGSDPRPSGKCIGGDRFYNREGLLPKGHTYYECDIDTLGRSSRGSKRIVYSTDGLIYYTSNHYRSFTLLYGDP